MTNMFNPKIKLATAATGTVADVALVTNTQHQNDVKEKWQYQVST